MFVQVDGAKPGPRLQRGGLGLTRMALSGRLAEREGFEPSIRF